MNEAFAVELFDLIEANGPDYWICGTIIAIHRHLKISNTTMLTNQLGYVKDGEQKGFQKMQLLMLQDYRLFKSWQPFSKPEKNKNVILR